MTKPNKTSYDKTERNTVCRVPRRADYDVDTVHRLFDQAWFCHVGFVSETGPTVSDPLSPREIAIPEYIEEFRCKRNG